MSLFEINTLSENVSFSAVGVMETDELDVAVGSVCDGRMAIIELKKFGIRVVGGQELHNIYTAHQNATGELIADTVNFILGRLTPGTLKNLLRHTRVQSFQRGKRAAQREIREALGL